MIELKSVSKTYKPKKGSPVKAVNDVSLGFLDNGFTFVL